MFWRTAWKSAWGCSPCFAIHASLSISTICVILTIIFSPFFSFARDCAYGLRLSSPCGFPSSPCGFPSIRACIKIHCRVEKSFERHVDATMLRTRRVCVAHARRHVVNLDLFIGCHESPAIRAHANETSVAVHNSRPLFQAFFVIHLTLLSGGGGFPVPPPWPEQRWCKSADRLLATCHGIRWRAGR